VQLAVPTETRPGERRVALVPDVVKKLVAAGWQIAVQSGAGVAAAFSDQAYEAAGATIAPDAAAVHAGAVAGKGATVFSFDLLPRISRAQSMDALSSQATVSGYRAGPPRPST
jgi:NAD(P) transhydrogenase subunit alpha